MHWTDLEHDEEIFTWEHPATHKQYHWAVSRMQRWAQHHAPIHKIEADSRVAKIIFDARGLEPARLQVLLDQRIRRPVLFVRWPKEHTLFVDEGQDILAAGNHRYVAAACNTKPKHRILKAWILDVQDWQEFLVEGLPQTENMQAVLQSYSGVLPGGQMDPAYAEKRRFELAKAKLKQKIERGEL